MSPSDIRNEVTTWERHYGTYSFHKRVEGCVGIPPHEQVLMKVFVHVTFQVSPNVKPNLVGYMESIIVWRPHPYFHKQATEMMQPAFQSVACELFTSDGSRCCAREDVLSIEDKGSILFINKIETSRKGIDLGLRMVHQTMVFVDDWWSVVIMKVRSPEPDDCRMDFTYRRMLNNSNNNEQERRDDSTKLAKHFVRMGFQQIGMNEVHYNILFLSHHLYRERTDREEPLWMTKEEAAIQTFVPPPLNFDDNDLEQLKACLYKVVLYGTMAEMDIEVIHRLATKERIDGQLFFHLIASRWGQRDLFDLFAERGGNVNMTSGMTCGRSPLHGAAINGNTIGYQVLVELGADPLIQDSTGSTPLDYIREYCFQWDVNWNPIIES